MSKVYTIASLKKTLSLLFPEVSDAFYWIKNDTKEEMVRIQFMDGNYKDINVTADSEPVMVLEVIRKLHVLLN